ncbi:MAG: sigma-70 family RNA polymerase sigma factor [Armatimonadota bacterium]|nr:sigma-70 family RNA polymerase sigma factor [bacterium]MCS7310671.1 sigma-70 family RNA polymerase sigma factor [Armatimonadota bacterium]MDW8104323.1 sigma-70 family RNA polymerase sigma factor [Armatimonadota bacterium]MDW8290819.1 sigma-70 family RNA polymerase sigma factor [Armatimonadota bacterium]
MESGAVALSHSSGTVNTADADRQAIERFLSGDVAAFEELYHRYQPYVYNVVHGIVQNPEDARDVTQEVFLHVYDALSRFRGGSAFSTWLYRVAVNTAITYVRKERRHARVPLDSLRELRADLDAEPEHQADRAEMQQEVQQTLAQLPEQHRAVLVLRYFQDLSLEEIAQAMNCSVAAVKVRLHRARHSFRRLLTGRFPQGDDQL